MRTTCKIFKQDSALRHWVLGIFPTSRTMPLTQTSQRHHHHHHHQQQQQQQQLSSMTLIISDNLSTVLSHNSLQSKKVHNDERKEPRLIAVVASWEGAREGRNNCTPPLNFGLSDNCRKHFIVGKISTKNPKSGADKNPFGENLVGKLKFEHTQSPVSEICNCLLF